MNAAFKKVVSDMDNLKERLETQGLSPYVNVFTLTNHPTCENRDNQESKYIRMAEKLRACIHAPILF